jgi:pimeloyl-ACP methyl ester carboxylesterase
MVHEVPFRITDGPNGPIRGDFRWSGRPSGNLPLLIICHGFTAHKDWGFFPHVGRVLAGKGFATAVFNFSHNGVGENPRRFTEIDRFERNTIGRELQDLGTVVDRLPEMAPGLGCPVDGRDIGLVGHSRGGGIAILSASRHAGIAAVAGWATISTFYRYNEHQRTVWLDQGYLPVTIRGSRTRLRYGREMLEDLEAHRQEYGLVDAVRRLKVPLLLVHGSADVSVKPKEPEELIAAADPSQSRLIMIEGTGHSFGSGHPFEGPAAVVDRVVDDTATWFKGVLDIA